MSYTIKQKADYAINWIDKLPGFEQDKTGGRLGSVETGFCCLGVGCVVTNTKFDSEDSNSKTFQKKIGLINDYGDLGYNERGRPNRHLGVWTLTEVNDNTTAGFDDIAGLMKDKPHWMFIPKVAKLIEQHYKLEEKK